jgi:hypothetical protein
VNVGTKDQIVTEDRTLIDVDKRGRVSLARFGLKDMQLVVDRLPDGALVLQQAIALTPAEAAHYRDPAAVAALERGLADYNAGRTGRGELRSKPRD